MVWSSNKRIFPFDDNCYQNRYKNIWYLSIHNKNCYRYSIKVVSKYFQNLFAFCFDTKYLILLNCCLYLFLLILLVAVNQMSFVYRCVKVMRKVWRNYGSVKALCEYKVCWECEWIAISVWEWWCKILLLFCRGEFIHIYGFLKIILHFLNRNFSYLQIKFTTFSNATDFTKVSFY